MSPRPSFALIQFATNIDVLTVPGEFGKCWLQSISNILGGPVSKKMAKLALVAGCLTLVLAGWLRAEGKVTIVLKNGDVLKGEMLGSDADSLSLQMSDGKAKEISLDEIKKAYDSQGKALQFGKESSSEESSDEAPAKSSGLKTPKASATAANAAQQAKADHMETIANWITYPSMGVFLVGGLVGIEYDGGAINSPLFWVGLGGMLTGGVFKIISHGMQPEDDEALLNFQKSRVVLALPKMTVVPSRNGLLGKVELASF
jgi:hypothetical protein